MFIQTSFYTKNNYKKHKISVIRKFKSNLAQFPFHIILPVPGRDNITAQLQHQTLSEGTKMCHSD